MANGAPDGDRSDSPGVWLATQIQGLETAKISVADFAIGDRPDLAALRIGHADASCLLIDKLGTIRATLYEALHQCDELEVRRQQGG